MTVECGKPLAESKAEVASGAASVEWFAEEGRRVCGDVLETVARDRRMVRAVCALRAWSDQRMQRI
jgi:succinate-semialdehyde dehydrogenase/glutarate-semialdehyde dehydrogenase